MRAVTLIDAALLDATSSKARGSARLRMNHNFHLSEAEPANRLLNAVEPGSYVTPHRHLDPAKDETFVVVRGRFGLVCFDESGAVTLT
jgi:cupin fold WbuC family metalloprotein